MSTTVSDTIGGTTTALFGTNVFSAGLIASTSFDFSGRRQDLAHHIGAGITQFGTSAATEIEPAPAGYKRVLPFTGSAIALGRAG